MSQDNNEAASARLLRAVKVYALNYLQDEAEEVESCTCGPKQHAEAKEVFAAIAAAEAAVPVPRVGGNTSNESPGSAHIAPQAAADTGAVDAADVDTPAFARLLLAWHEARVDKSRGTDVSAEANAIVAHVAGLCAQQREAVRLERKEEVRMLTKSLCEIQQKYFTLARQPVSEGYEALEDRLAGACVECGVSDSTYEALCDSMRRAALAAVPPAKAEGLSDETLWKLVAAMQGQGYNEGTRRARAILAQQATKGGTA